MQREAWLVGLVAWIRLRAPDSTPRKEHLHIMANPARVIHDVVNMITVAMVSRPATIRLC